VKGSVAVVGAEEMPPGLPRADRGSKAWRVRGRQGGTRNARAAVFATDAGLASLDPRAPYRFAAGSPYNRQPLDPIAA